MNFALPPSSFFDPPTSNQKDVLYAYCPSQAQLRCHPRHPRRRWRRRRSRPELVAVLRTVRRPAWLGSPLWRDPPEPPYPLTCSVFFSVWLALNTTSACVAPDIVIRLSPGPLRWLPIDKDQTATSSRRRKRWTSSGLRSAAAGRPIGRFLLAARDCAREATHLPPDQTPARCENSRFSTP